MPNNQTPVYTSAYYEQREYTHTEIREVLASVHANERVNSAMVSFLTMLVEQLMREYNQLELENYQLVSQCKKLSNG